MGCSPGRDITRTLPGRDRGYRALGETRPLVVTFQLSPLKSSVIETPVSDSAAIDRAALAARSQLRYETAVVLVRP